MTVSKILKLMCGQNVNLSGLQYNSNYIHLIRDCLPLKTRDPKVSHFLSKKTLEKWDTLGTFSQKVPLLAYNKTKKEKSGTLWDVTLCDVTLWSHGLYS